MPEMDGFEAAAKIRANPQLKKQKLVAITASVFPEFKESSYLDRYKILCQKLMLERHYSQSCLIWSKDDLSFGNVADEISIESFIYSFIGHLTGQIKEFR